MSGLQEVLDRIDNGLDASLARLFELLRIQSISTDPAFAGQCMIAADWLVGQLGEIGFDARLCLTDGHPMVLARHYGPEGSPHALLYGHYDVQPVDPVELWYSPPFEPAVQDSGDGRRLIFGRGTSDDKGQLMTFLEAARAWKEATGSLPIGMTILLEGEEESGSPSLGPFLDSYHEELASDFALVCDTNMWDPDTPAIVTSLRGLVSEEVTIHAADRDLHSGIYGSAAANPNHLLARILADLHDSDGRVTLPGFYDGVSEPDSEILAGWNALDFDADRFMADFGLKFAAGERDRSVLEQIWSRPTAEVNGMTGGYTGEGMKTVIPAIATAKISFRLVEGQDPETIRNSFREHVRSRLPGDCTARFAPHGGSPAIQLDLDMPELKKATEALREEWGKPPARIAMGGSIPIVGAFADRLGIKSLLIGFALSDDNIHSPNEKYDLRSFHKGMRSWARIFEGLAG